MLPKIRERYLAIVMLDIIGSTQFVQKVGRVKASRWLNYHDRMTRSLIYRYNGREIDRSDGFLLSFESINEAVGFALTYQKQIPLKTKLNCRIGIHWDCVAELTMHELDLGTKQIELEGVGKNITARTMSICMPGQVLITKQAMKMLYATSNTRDARRACVGLYKFKGVKEAMEIWAIGFDIKSLQPPQGSDKVKRLGGPKKIKQRARDRQIIDWGKWLFWRVGILNLIWLIYSFAPWIVSDYGRLMLSDYLYPLYYLIDFINESIGG